MNTTTRAAAAGIAALSFAGLAGAATFSFTNITGNNATHAAAGESQLSLDVLSAGPGVAQFVLSNASSGMASSVRGIWIDNAGGVLASIAGIVTAPGVVYTAGSSGSLPGGESVSFSATHALGLKASSPAPAKGVNPGESLTWTYNIAGGFAFADVIDAMNSGDLRLGLHLIALPNNGSEGFVTTPNDDDTPTDMIPAPMSGLLAGAGLFAVGARRRR